MKLWINVSRNVGPGYYVNTITNIEDKMIQKCIKLYEHTHTHI